MKQARKFSLPGAPASVQVGLGAGAQPMTDQLGSSITIIYDGECPFCRSYVTYCRLREAFGEVTLTDAREVPELIAGYRARGIEINKGMIVIHEGTVHHGRDAMDVLARLTRPAGIFQRLIRVLLHWPPLGALVYGALRLGRDATLLVLGRGKVN